MYEVDRNPTKSYPLIIKHLEDDLVLDKESFIINVNKVYADILGYKIEEMVGKHFFSFIDKSNIDFFKLKIYQLKEGSNEIFDGQLIKKNGDKIIAKFNLAPIFSINGNFLGIKVISQKDLNDNSNKHLMGLDNIEANQLFYNSPIATYILFPDGKLAEINNAFLEIMGYDREEIFKIPFQDITHPTDWKLELKLADKIINNRLDNYELEKRFIKKCGSSFWVKMYVNAVRDSRKNLLYNIVMLQDLFTEKMLQEKLICSEHMAHIGESISNLSHAIKSPLSIIGMNIDFLKNQCNDKKCFNPILPIIQKELKHIDHLIQEVLNYSRHNNLQSIIFNIQEKVESIITELNPVIQLKNIKIINNINNIRISADAQKIYTLFLTLIENSIESIGENGTIEFFSEPCEKTKFIDIYIRDTGRGFVDPDSAFKPFYTTKPKGTGMGLPIAKNLVQDHQGTIELISTEPGNTIIRFSLPLAE